jgi:hypothetical protein
MFIVLAVVQYVSIFGNADNDKTMKLPFHIYCDQHAYFC